uniref:Ribosome biogenesis protein BMS1/TSR1 C-terminal domain-containing protein n=1 Tax=Emiliania huxleyi (strain CCMP1516) TaxID=280463 RepID=A0A0D3IUF6_EMIH1
MLVLQAGFRRYAARPIFSEDNRRSTKHKLERFVQPGRQVVATVYAPAMYAPCPLLAFLPDGEAPPCHIGALLSVDADRIILKRILLTGAPFRCHKKKASVRWMFFSPDDVRWFKPVELHTKFGRKGHIRSSLGTHGYMKCYFDGTMQQHDTVCMSLYKRAFPKWSGPFSYECE